MLSGFSRGNLVEVSFAYFLVIDTDFQLRMFYDDKLRSGKEIIVEVGLKGLSEICLQSSNSVIKTRAK
jgi:hypothetical protein